MSVYLDNSATTKQHDFVSKAVSETAENYYGNPSSLHRKGMEAEKLLKSCRKNIAATIGASEEEIFFTSGGTESNNTVFFGASGALHRRGNHIITTSVEHPAVLECCKKLETKGFDVTYVSVDEYGMADPEEIKSEIRPETILISVMSVNNELGTVQPIKEIGRLKSDNKEILFHTDDVQGYGKLDLGITESNIDLLSVSSHKIHGPRGIGFLYVKKGTRIDPIIYGGGQERGFRSGTENLPAIKGFEVAAEYAHKEMKRTDRHLNALRTRLLNNIKDSIKDIRINSRCDNSFIPGILNISFLGTRGEVLLHMLEQDEIYVSTGSACSAHKKGGSHVLKAAGLSDEEIEGAIRFSFCEYNTEEQIDFTADRLKKAVDSVRKTMRYKLR